MKRFLSLLLALLILGAPVRGAGFTPIDDPAEATAGNWILPLAARGATQTVSGTINTTGQTCAMLVVSISAGTGFSLVMRVQVADPQTGTFFTVFGSPVAMTTTGNYHYVLCPGSASNAALTGSYATNSGGLYLPPIWRMAITAPDTTSVTYSVTGVTW